MKWPNVSLASLPRFDANLKTWFKRKSVPIWVTEYGHQTRPEDSLGVSYATQAAYIQQSISIATKLSVREHVHLVRLPGRSGPAVGVGSVHALGCVERVVARGLPPGRGTDRRAKRGLRFQSRNDDAARANVYVRRYCANDAVGTAIGMTWRVFRAGRLLEVGQQSSPLLRDCTITARLRFPGSGIAKGVSYTATFELNDANGILLERRLTIRGT